MILRTEDGGVLCISQPAHAWMSGQMADAWREDDRFGFEPRSEVCLGAAQHDCGWVEWEESPTWNPETGLPHSFMELSTSEHLAIWRRAPRRAAVQSRYAGLVVSLHGTGLYSRYGNPGEPMVREYLDQEGAWQREQRSILAADERFAPHVTEAAIRRNQKLVAAWDLLSLSLCRGITEPKVIGGVPAGDGLTDFAITPTASGVHLLSPWPFREIRVTFHCDAFRLSGTFADETSMRQAIRTAPSVTLAFPFEAG